MPIFNPRVSALEHDLEIPAITALKVQMLFGECLITLSDSEGSQGAEPEQCFDFIL